MSHLCWLFVPFWGGERPRGGVTGPLGIWRGTPATFNGGSTKVGFHNRGVQWDTPMAKWAGEVKDWIQLMTQTQPRREDIIRSMKQPVDKKKESEGSVPTKKPRDLPPLDLGIPAVGERPTLEIKGDNKTIEDWMNRHAKMKSRSGTVEKAQNLQREWWGRGIRLRQRTTEWVTHTFREHYKEADWWADMGAKARVEDWVDTTRIAWQDVTGVCGFWDGSYDNGKCGCPICVVRSYWSLWILGREL